MTIKLDFITLHYIYYFIQWIGGLGVVLPAIYSCAIYLTVLPAIWQSFWQIHKDRPPTTIVVLLIGAILAMSNVDWGCTRGREGGREVGRGGPWASEGNSSRQCSSIESCSSSYNPENGDTEIRLRGTICRSSSNLHHGNLTRISVSRHFVG